MRVLINSDGYVTSPTFTDDTGEAADLDADPTCEVAREDGTALTDAVVDDPTADDGQYRAKLLAAEHTGTLDWLTLTWTGTMTGVGTIVVTQRVDVVGGTYTTVPELRAAPYSIDPTKVSAQAINDKIEEFERLAEEYCGYALVPRYQADKLIGRGGTTIQVRKQYIRTLISATAIDTAGAATPFEVTGWQVNPITGIVATDGDGFTPSVYGEPNIIIRYTHGLDHPPVGLTDACKQWVKNQVLQDKSGYGRDVLSATNPEGFSTRYSTPDWDAGRPTGLLDVDRALNSLGREAPTIL